jgi:hypothetical protein
MESIPPACVPWRAGYDNPIPTWFPALIDCLKIPALVSTPGILSLLCCRAKKNIRVGQAVSMLELTSEDRTQFRLYSDHALRSFTQ